MDELDPQGDATDVVPDIEPVTIPNQSNSPTIEERIETIENILNI